MSVSVTDDLVELYKRAVPADVAEGSLATDIAYTLATVIARAEQEVARLVAGAKISTSTGLWVDEHLRDHGLRRQSAETDAQAVLRLQKPPQAGTTVSILEALQLIVGASGPVFIVELPRDGFFYDREDSFYDRNSRYGGGRGVVIALIPASASAINSCADALRSKISAGKLGFVQEYTVGYP